MTLLSSGSNLFISQFNTSRHAGYYTCIVEGVAGRLVSCPSEVKHARKHISNIFNVYRRQNVYSQLSNIYFASINKTVDRSIKCSMPEI